MIERWWNGLRVRAPEGWEIAESDNALTLFPRECRAFVEANGPADSVLLQVVPGDAAQFDDVVAELMRRRVRQGEPECRNTSVFGLPALERVWTDGVTLHTSSFFVSASKILEVVVSKPLIRRCGEDTLETIAQAACGSLTLDDRPFFG